MIDASTSPAELMISESFAVIDTKTISLDLRKISENKVEIEQLWSEMVRGAGHGGAALRTIVAIADRHGVALVLTPTRLLYDENQRGEDYTDLMDDLNKQALTNEQLIGWYARHGFEPTGEWDDDRPLMSRMPQPAATPAPF